MNAASRKPLKPPYHLCGALILVLALTVTIPAAGENTPGHLPAPSA